MSEFPLFEEFNLGNPLQNALRDYGITTPTTIQRKTFTTIMSGKDVLGIAQTGTGKTLAFLLPALRLWKFSKSPLPQILIIVPTRELVAQIVNEVEKLTGYMNVVSVGVYGGTNIKTHKNAVAQGLDVIVGTPGRLLDLMKDGVLKTKQIKRLIIDEVDEMLNLGFRTQLKEITQFLPERRQNLMFSATIPEEVRQLIELFTSYYETIEAAPSGAPLKNINQYAYRVPNFNSKYNLLHLLLSQEENMSRVLVFVSTKKMANALFDKMHEIYKEQVGVIHSSKSQNNRFDAVSNFQNGNHRVLVTTDIIARGLDVYDVSHVVNFDLPVESERYIHRIGRTGRAEKRGEAISFVSDAEKEYREEIEKLMDFKINLLELPKGYEESTELIELEIEVDHVPFNSHKMKQHKPSGAAFHEKSDKNKKVNKKVHYADLMKKKYKKPKTRGQKKKK